MPKAPSPNNGGRVATMRENPNPLLKGFCQRSGVVGVNVSAHRLQESIPGYFNHMGVEPHLVAKMPVNRRIVHVGTLRDALDGCPLKTLPRKQHQRGINYLLPRRRVSRAIIHVNSALGPTSQHRNDLRSDPQYHALTKVPRMC